MNTKRVAATLRWASSHPSYSTGKSAQLDTENRPNRLDTSPEGAKDVSPMHERSLCSFSLHSLSNAARTTSEANGFDHRLSRFSICAFLFSLFRSRHSPGQTPEEVHIIEVLP